MDIASRAAVVIADLADAGDDQRRAIALDRSSTLNFTRGSRNVLSLDVLDYNFYPPQLVPAGTPEARISYCNSVCLSVRLSQPGGIPSSGEIETPSLHDMVAWSIQFPMR